MSSSEAMLELCQSCFALNNVGVTLMEKNRFRAAAVTFYAAISALKTAAALPDQYNVKAFLTLRNRLAKASAWAAQKQRQGPSCGVEIMAVDNDDGAALEAAHLYGPAASLVFPIRFRELPTMKCLENGLDAQIITVVFYNAGLAQMLHHRCLGIAAQASERAHPSAQVALNLALAKAARFFSVANRALQFNVNHQLPHSSQQTTTDNHDSSIDQFRVLCLSSMVLASWSVTLRYRHEKEKVAQIEARLEELEQMRLLWEQKTILVAREDQAAGAA